MTRECVARFRNRASAAWLAAAALAFAPVPASAQQQAAASPATPVPTELPTTVERVTFGDGTGQSVIVIRGAGPSLAAPPGPPALPRPGAQRIETVRFAATGEAPVTVIRGAHEDRGFGLFRPASGGEIDRVAFAVEGVESGHGTNPLMWRSESEGPQGPMQVSAAAALGVGGGDRFDIPTNRALGRAFLADMYRRYGNWPDALAAYNWGPGHVDAWIAAGRPEERLPLETQRYIELVLRDAVMGRLRL